ncbi:hypothetical protein F511_36790 [Dorcoceras hygrometricum]|uniref:Uncharacterized protein n=1 Tax=Dorcoceras hygrometricum TaxID=472368 RepID=A0A2Z7DEP5_9LAMI|nr:hypothetical protein F511_36790 [Dorcoceras hygrometricum]
MHINSWFTVAHVWMYCSFLLVSLESCTCWFLARNHLLNLSAKEKRYRIHLSKRHRFAIANFKYHRLVLLYLTAYCDDITADVISADPALALLINC